MKLPTKEIDYCELENDLNRFPVPIEFNPQMEQRKLYRRDRHIREIYDRYMQMVNNIYSINKVS